MTTILGRWHRPRRGSHAAAHRPDPFSDPSPARTPTVGRAVEMTRTWWALMVGLLVFAAASAAVILAH